MGVIGHGGLLSVFSFARPIRGSGHVYGIYSQTCPEGRRLGFRAALLSSGRIVPRVTIGGITPSG